MTKSISPKSIKVKAEKKEEPQFEPWDEEQKADLQFAIDQESLRVLENQQEAMKLKIGLDEIDKEINTNIDHAAMKVKAAKINLACLIFDKDNNITIRRIKNKITELEKEIKRLEGNANAFTQQLKDGRPVRHIGVDIAQGKDETVEREIDEELDENKTQSKETSSAK